MVNPDSGAVRKVLQDSIDGWRQLNADMVLSTISKNETFIWGTDEDETWKDFEEFAGAVHRQVEAFENTSYEWEEGHPEVRVYGDMAYAFGVQEVTVKSGHETVKAKMRTSFVLERYESEWAIVHAHYSVGQSDRVVKY